MAYKPTGRSEIARLEKHVNDLFDRVEPVKPEDQLKGDLNRYIAVRVSGYLEQAVVALARSACSTGAFGETQRFSLSWLDRAPNPSSRELVRLANRFSVVWAEDLERFLGEEERGSRLNALIGIRNDIAHGKNQGVSLQQARDYFGLARDVVAWLAERLEPLPGAVPA